jgi:glycosyltransferase involved in cell wall biosynthesis
VGELLILKSYKEFEEIRTVDSLPNDQRIHTVSVVIPVYAGRETLNEVVEELKNYYSPRSTPNNLKFEVREIILVDDCGTDNSAEVIRDLMKLDPRIVPVWLTRNYGQHAATIAGMATSSADWLLTIDEDGQHDPSYLGEMLDLAITGQCPLVYGRERDQEPHGKFRNFASRHLKKFILPLLFEDKNFRYFSSFRLMTGATARTVAAFANHGAYLDVVLNSIARTSEICFVQFRSELRPTSSYTNRKLVAHFARLVVSSGTRPLRIISVCGGAAFVIGTVAALLILLGKLVNGYSSNGWASLISMMLILGGAILTSLGIIAEYVGVLIRQAIGLPLYVVGQDPEDGPLSRKW